MVTLITSTRHVSTKFRFHNVASMRTIEYLDGDVAFAPRMRSQNIKENYDFVDEVVMTSYLQQK